MRTIKRYAPWLMLAGLALFVLPACIVTDTVTGLLGGSDKEATPIVVVLPSAPTEVAPLEPAEPPSADVPAPESAPVSGEQGASRANPFPVGALVSAPNWEVQVLEFKRGAEAWADISAAYSYSDPAPEGMEYVLIKVHVKSTYADNEEHNIGRCDFKVTGDRNTLYDCSTAFVLNPEPSLDATLYSGGESEGWIAYPVGAGEGNLMLVVDELMNFDQDVQTYIALEEGASITIPSTLASIAPTGTGIERLEPAKINETVVTEDWEIRVTEVVRGQAALDMVLETNEYSEQPAAGMEYLAVKIYAHCIATEDKPYNIDEFSFESTGDSNTIYDFVAVVDPDPQLSSWLYPDGEREGWIVVQAAVGETGVKLIFEPWLDFSGDSKRFLSLE